MIFAMDVCAVFNGNYRMFFLKVS